MKAHKKWKILLCSLIQEVENTDEEREFEIKTSEDSIEVATSGSKVTLHHTTRTCRKMSNCIFLKY